MSVWIHTLPSQRKRKLTMDMFAQLTLAETLAETRANARAQRAAREDATYTDFGIRHGGSNRLHTLVNTVFALTTGAIALVLLTMLSMHMSPTVVVVTILSIGFTSLGTNLALCALYLRPRRLINLLSRCAMWFLIPVGVLTAVLYTLYCIF